MPNPTFDNQNEMRVPYTKGNINYELSNLPMAIGMGNMLAVLSVRRIAHTNSGVVEYYSPDIVSCSDYYPFGMVMGGRSFSTNQYGFNGKEKGVSYSLRSIGNAMPNISYVQDANGQTITRVTSFSEVWSYGNLQYRFRMGLTRTPFNDGTGRSVTKPRVGQIFDIK